jgi:dihydromethanopterin reductase (acceptor)
MFLAWGVTGAGHFLFESFNLMKKVARKKDVKVTTYLTRAGEEVVKRYGLWSSLREVSDGSYYSEILTEKVEGASSPSAGRLARGVYRGLIVAPASANTVAKIRFGIADTLVTNAVAQALKSGTPVLILPTDQTLEELETRLPTKVNREICRGCLPCPSETACPTGALKRVEGKMRVEPLLCEGCRLCIDSCLFEAVRFGERIRVKPRRVDVENAEALRQMEGLKVVASPEELRKLVDSLLGGSGS